MDVKPGQVFVPGVSSRTARALLSAAAKAGLNPKQAVRTTDGGFVVPELIDPSATPKKAARGRKKSTTKEG